MIKSLAIRLATWRQYRTTVRELTRLSERELNDLGIGRSDIRAIASGAPVLTGADVDVASVVGGRTRGATAATAALVQPPLSLAA